MKAFSVGVAAVVLLATCGSSLFAETRHVVRRGGDNEKFDAIWTHTVGETENLYCVDPGTKECAWPTPRIAWPTTGYAETQIGTGVDAGSWSITSGGYYYTVTWSSDGTLDNVDILETKTSVLE